jgi:hypothetical protein
VRVVGRFGDVCVHVIELGYLLQQPDLSKGRIVVDVGMYHTPVGCSPFAVRQSACLLFHVSFFVGLACGSVGGTVLLHYRQYSHRIVVGLLHLSELTPMLAAPWSSFESPGMTVSS